MRMTRTSTISQRGVHHVQAKSTEVHRGHAGRLGHIDVASGVGRGSKPADAPHRALGQAAQSAIAALGLGQVPLQPEYAAHTMTAPRYPSGISAAELLPRIKEAGAVLAGGLHPEIKAEYFRIGHMGAAKPGDLLATVGALEVGLVGCGYEFELGTGVAAAAASYQD